MSLDDGLAPLQKTACRDEATCRTSSTQSQVNKLSRTVDSLMGALPPLDLA